MARHGRVFSVDPEYPGDGPSRSVVDVHKGWTIMKDRESGLMIVYLPNGRKYGQTQTEAGARIMRRKAIERSSRPSSP